jgi:3-hydroxy-9,10-secoandrosta-1,3,5(10)-triene-9,17-dione monooxygenase
MPTSTRSKPRARKIPVPKPRLTPDGMVKAAVALRPMLRERQADTEAAGRVLPEVADKCIEAGFFRMLQPRRFGGYEFDLPTFARVAIELARGCPSTGWGVVFTSGHPHVFAKFPEQAQIEAYGDKGEFRAPMVGGQGAAARKVDGGYVISGAWDYASGIDMATHLLATAPIRDNLEDEPSGLIVALFNKGQYEIVRNWDMFGMQGSGSHRVVVKDELVPLHRAYHRTLLGPGASPPEERIFDNPFYAGPSTNVLMAEIAAVAVGTGYAALDCYEELLQRRTTPRTTKIRAEDREFQVYFGEATALLDTARAALMGCCQEYMDDCREDVEGKSKFTPEKSARLVLVEQQCCRIAGDAVNLMFRMAGTSQIKPGMPMQRYFRDMSTLLTHNTMAFDRNYEQVTKMHYGFDIAPPAPRSAEFAARG